MKFRLLLILTLAITPAACLRPGKASAPVARAPVFVSENPQSIYAANPNDSWNRIFHALFTRTITHRVSGDFPEGAPFIEFHETGIGPHPLRVSKETFRKLEIGDRAIEPLYPTFFTNQGPAQLVSEPLFSEFTSALRQAIDEPGDRSPIARALMQADA